MNAPKEKQKKNHYGQTGIAKEQLQAQNLLIIEILSYIQSVCDESLDNQMKETILAILLKIKYETGQEYLPLEDLLTLYGEPNEIFDEYQTAHKQIAIFDNASVQPIKKRKMLKRDNTKQVNCTTVPEVDKNFLEEDQPKRDIIKTVVTTADQNQKQRNNQLVAYTGKKGAK